MSRTVLVDEFLRRHFGTRLAYLFLDRSADLVRALGQAGTTIPADLSEVPRGKGDGAQSLLKMDPLNDLMEDQGSETGEEVINKKPLRSPHSLQKASEHGQHEHVDEDVEDAPVHEHMGYKLMGHEERGIEIEEPQSLDHLLEGRSSKHGKDDESPQEDDHVDVKKVLGNPRKVFEHGSAEAFG